jgi:hypothetical protein
MPSQSARTVTEGTASAGTLKKVSLRAAFRTLSPRELRVVSGDQVVWEIDSIGATQRLIIESADPRFPFHVRGDRGAVRVKLDVSYSGSKITVRYSVSLQDASGGKTRFNDEPMTPSLLIDRGGQPPTPIGPPQPPPGPPAHRALRGLGRNDKA